MSKPPLTSPVHFHGPAGHFWAVTSATALAHAKRSNAYLIDVLRWPLFPLSLYAATRLSYAIAGQEEVDGVGVSGFLLVGMVGLITWTSTIWASGYAIEYERSGGTAAALFVSPASRVAVIAGYGLGSFLWLLPSYAVVIALGVATGARPHVSDPLALAAALAVVALASLATGFALAGLFILSRRANQVANFLQQPIYLLAGFVVPRAALPGWLLPISAIIPASHANDALLAAALHGASLGATGPALTLALLTSTACALIGVLGLRRVEQSAKRAGHLDLY